MAINHRNYKIDFLRGIAIGLVLLLHFHLSYRLDQSALNVLFNQQFLKSLARNGNYGVTIFFVISGFLITSTSLDRYGKLANINYIKFYIYRFARIMPCLLLALGLIALLNFLHVPNFENSPSTTSFGLAILSVMTFWHNLLMQNAGYFNYCLNIYWSLSVEEIFYLSFPLVAIALRQTKYFCAFLCVFILIAPIYRYFNSNDEIIALYGYLSCFDAIAVGCLVAIFSRYWKIRVNFGNLLLLGSGLAIIAVYFYAGIMSNVIWGVSLIAFATGIFVFAASQDKSNSVPIFARPVCWLGRHSYELYLFHIIVLAIIKEFAQPGHLNGISRLFYLILFLTGSILTAYIISRLYSEPMNRSLRSLLLFRQDRNLTTSVASGLN